MIQTRMPVAVFNHSDGGHRADGAVTFATTIGVVAPRPTRPASIVLGETTQWADDATSAREPGVGP
jgi:hypothetical protein